MNSFPYTECQNCRNRLLQPKSSCSSCRFGSNYNPTEIELKPVIGAYRTLMALPSIRQVIFNDPATIVFWADGTKTVVKAYYEIFDPEKGLAMAIAKKAMGNGSYYPEIKKWTNPYRDKKAAEEPLPFYHAMRKVSEAILKATNTMNQEGGRK